MKLAAQHKIALFIALSFGLHLSIIFLFKDKQKTEYDKTQKIVSVELHKTNNTGLDNNTVETDSISTKPNKPATSKTPIKAIAKKTEQNLPKKTGLLQAPQKETEQPVSPDATGFEIENNRPAVTEKNQKESIDYASISSILNHELSRYFYYPKIAQRRNWQGQVILSFTILSDGDITKIKINESSGYRVLDNAAMDALDQIEQRNLLALALNGHTLEQTLPITYKLLNQ